MLSYISDLKMKEKGRRLFCSLKCGLICCFMASLSVLVIALVFDSVDGIVDLEIYIQYVFASAFVLLFSFVILYLFRFFPLARSGLNWNNRSSIIIIKKHFMAFFAVSLIVSIIAYLVFLYLARNQSEKVDLNLARIAKMQVKQVNDWRNRQAYLSERYAGDVRIIHEARGFEEKMNRLGNRMKKGIAGEIGGDPEVQSIHKLFSLTGRYDLVNVLKYRRVWMGPPKKIKDINGKWLNVLTMYVPFLKMKPEGKEAGIKTHYVDPSDSLIPRLSVLPAIGMSSRVFLFSRYGEEIVVLRNSDYCFAQFIE